MLRHRLGKERYTIVYTDPEETTYKYSATGKAFTIVFDNIVTEELYSMKDKMSFVVKINRTADRRRYSANVRQLQRAEDISGTDGDRLKRISLCPAYRGVRSHIL